jgi:hypothetical protein
MFFPERPGAARAGSAWPEPASGDGAIVNVPGLAWRTVDPRELLDLFAVCAAAQRGALATLSGDDRRARTDKPGQYALDLVADAAVLPVLHAAGLRVLSEESGWTGPEGGGHRGARPVERRSTSCVADPLLVHLPLYPRRRGAARRALVEHGVTGAAPRSAARRHALTLHRCGLRRPPSSRAASWPSRGCPSSSGGGSSALGSAARALRRGRRSRRRTTRRPPGHAPVGLLSVGCSCVRRPGDGGRCRAESSLADESVRRQLLAAARPSCSRR